MAVTRLFEPIDKAVTTPVCVSTEMCDPEVVQLMESTNVACPAGLYPAA